MKQPCRQNSRPRGEADGRAFPGPRGEKRRRDGRAAGAGVIRELSRLVFFLDDFGDLRGSYLVVARWILEGVKKSLGWISIRASSHSPESRVQTDNRSNLTEDPMDGDWELSLSLSQHYDDPMPCLLPHGGCVVDSKERYVSLIVILLSRGNSFLYAFL